MNPSTSSQQEYSQRNVIPDPVVTPKSLNRLKRQVGTTVLNQSCRRETTISLLKHSNTMTVLPRFSSFKPESSGVKDTEPPVQKQPRLSRTTTAIGPLDYASLKEVPRKWESLKRTHEERKVTPMRIKVEKTPGGSFSSFAILPKRAPIPQNEVTPPSVLQRSTSGSMMLRQTPTRSRKFDASPQKKVRRSGSVPKPSRELSEVDTTVPFSSRATTSSVLIDPGNTMPHLTPQKSRFRRPRVQSESDDVTTTPSRKLAASPLKKRIRGVSESSPLKTRRNLRLEGGGGQEKPTTSQDTAESVKLIVVEEVQECSVEMGQSTSSFLLNCVGSPPKLTTRSTSGDTYYSATDEQPEDVVDQESLQKTTTTSDVFLTPLNSHLDKKGEGGEEMVPLVKKQMSIDEKCMEDEEDEGFGDSTKTIKKGMGGALARSLSLKLSPRKDEQKPIGADTEKSCSTPSLPTAPLVRQASTSSLRFKVSPSTFLRPLPTVASTPEAAPSPIAEPTSPVVTPIGSSEPSTSKTPVETPVSRKKSSLKSKETLEFAVRNHEETGEDRTKRVKYSGLKVFYFDRRQGDMTVPSEGEVTLDMHTEHYTQRYFPLSSGKRPLLDLALYSDEELSDGEVIDPDSDPEEFEEYSSARHKAPYPQKERIKMLKKAGIKVERYRLESSESIRRDRMDCGCSCENGVCDPETCFCVINGMQCQVDGTQDPHPCKCTDACANPNGRIFYDQAAVKSFVNGSIARFKAGLKTGIEGTPVHKKFTDSEDDEGEQKCLEVPLEVADADPSVLSTPEIPARRTQLEDPEPPRYPVTPIYTTRRSSHCSQSEIRESSSELPMTLSERMRTLQSLDNDVFLEEPVQESNTVAIPVAANIAEEREEEEAFSSTNADNERLEATMSSPQTTMVV